MNRFAVFFVGRVIDPEYSTGVNRPESLSYPRRRNYFSTTTVEWCCGERGVETVYLLCSYRFGLDEKIRQHNRMVKTDSGDPSETPIETGSLSACNLYWKRAFPFARRVICLSGPSPGAVFWRQRNRRRTGGDHATSPRYLPNIIASERRPTPPKLARTGLVRAPKRRN